MAKHDTRVDAYIARSADFAKPVLEFLRETVHTAVPEVEETIKWGMPSFDDKGPLCNIAAFKAHCALAFWKASLLGVTRSDDAMGHLGRITSKRDLPPKKELIALIMKLAQLNEQGIEVPRARKLTKRASGASTRRSNGSPKASSATGST